ncbi:ICAM3 protein, partial [Columbina picui]|nr:ICAM3 protein [Columbina picui]
LLNVTEWNSSVLCFYRCHGHREVLSAKVVVYSPPERPVLSPVPPLAVGSPHDLSCAVSGAAPPRLLTLSLLLNGEPLRTKTFTHIGHDEPTTMSLTHPLTPQRGHHG